MASRDLRRAQSRYIPSSRALLVGSTVAPEAMVCQTPRRSPAKNMVKVGHAVRLAVMTCIKREPRREESRLSYQQADASNQRQHQRQQLEELLIDVMDQHPPRQCARDSNRR